jgi:hypothetical protein
MLTKVPSQHQMRPPEFTGKEGRFSEAIMGVSMRYRHATSADSSMKARCTIMESIPLGVFRLWQCSLPR